MGEGASLHSVNFVEKLNIGWAELVHGEFSRLIIANAFGSSTSCARSVKAAEAEKSD